MEQGSDLGPKKCNYFHKSQAQVKQNVKHPISQAGE